MNSARKVSEVIALLDTVPVEFILGDLDLIKYTSQIHGHVELNWWKEAQAVPSIAVEVDILVLMLNRFISCRLGVTVITLGLSIDYHAVAFIYCTVLYVGPKFMQIKYLKALE